MFKFEMGERLQDDVTGFSGIVVARLEYLNGCKQYCIKPSVKDNKMVEGEYIDENQLFQVEGHSFNPASFN